MEDLRATVAYFDKEYIWVVDDIVGGLYTLDIFSMDVVCRVTALELYKYSSFEVASIIEKEGVIIIVPKLLKDKWVFYNKKTGEISYQEIIGIDSYTPEIRMIDNFLYIPPVHNGKPFIVFDMNEMKPYCVIENICEENVKYEIWRTFRDGDMCCVPLRGTKTIYGISNITDRKIEVKIEEALGDADGKNGEYWVLPLRGKYIYCIDFDGNVIEKIELIVENGEKINANFFVRIVATDAYIFLLPWVQGEMFVYKKNAHKFSKIKRQGYDLTNEIVYDIDEIPYWGYFISKKKICFFPRLTKFMSIEFEGLSVEQKGIRLPDKNDYEEISKWIRLNRSNNVFQETGKEDLSIYMNYIKKNHVEHYFCDLEIGKRIYETMLYL